MRAGTGFPKDDMRQLLPRFKKDAMEANQPLIDVLNEVGRDKNFTSAQVKFA